MELADIHMQMSEVVFFCYIIHNNESEWITDNNIRATIIRQEVNIGINLCDLD